jgi:L-threonylcarbamoyladenylate synthase
VVTGGRPTVGLRVPAHPLTLELLARFGGGLAAPSANRFGRVSPTTAEHVRLDLGDDVDFVLDGGPCPIGVESTIVDCTVDPPQVLRPGAISAEEVASLLEQTVGDAAGSSRAPGMLESHYAPRCRVVPVGSIAEAHHLADFLPGAEILDEADLVVYAQVLYSRLRDADARGVQTVIAVLPPAQGLGHAIRDRLTKAAAAAR